jgi:hypothetical protein
MASSGFENSKPIVIYSFSTNIQCITNNESEYSLVNSTYEFLPSSKYTYNIKRIGRIPKFDSSWNFFIWKDNEQWPVNDVDMLMNPIIHAWQNPIFLKTLLDMNKDYLSLV